MAANGFPAGMDFSCPCGCSQGCFVVCSWNICSKPLMPANWSFSPRCESLRDRSSFLDYLAPLREAEWVVYAKRPFAGPEQVLDYVGRYTHRVAISNNRLLDIAEDKVTFRYKDYRHDAQQKTMTLEAEEFIRRFLLHVLPEGFQRIRYYGFLANRYREQKLAHCRELLDMPAPEPAASKASKDYRERYEELIGSSLWKCPVCHQGRMLMIEILPPKPTPVSDGDHGYLMMEKTVLGCRSNFRTHAWPNQATGAALPNRSCRSKSQAKISFPRPHHRSPHAPRSHNSVVCAHYPRPHRILARDPAENQYP